VRDAPWIQNKIAEALGVDVSEIFKERRRRWR